MDRFFKDINTRFRSLLTRETPEEDTSSGERETTATSQTDTQDETQSKSEDTVAAEDSPAESGPATDEDDDTAADDTGSGDETAGGLQLGTDDADVPAESIGAGVREQAALARRGRPGTLWVS